MVKDFQLHDTFSELFTTPLSEFEDDPTAIDRSGGEVIAEIIEAVGEEFVLLPPADANGPHYVVAEVERNTSLVIDDDIEIIPDEDGGVMVKASGDNRYVTATELRDVATADDLETVGIR
jgi:hypothetical protein